MKQNSLNNDNEALQTQKNQSLLEEVYALNDLDELGLLSDDGFMRRLYTMMQIVGDKHKKVFGEYEYVSKNVKNPVLMNKAIAISLSKTEVIALIDDLTKRYYSKLENVKGFGTILKNNGKIPLYFKDEVGAHANLNRTEIAFYTYGDWRMGFNFKFCAETVFHEFCHVLDFNRKKLSNIDSHDAKFVKILEEVLADYEAWILERYDYTFHVTQVLNNSVWLLNWEAIKRDVIEQDKSQQQKLNQFTKELDKKVANEIYANEDGLILLSKLVEDYEELTIKYIYDALNMLKEKSSNKSEINKLRKKIREDEIESALTMEELAILSEASKVLYPSEFSSSNTDIMNQIKLTNSLEKLITSINEITASSFSSGKSRYRKD